MPRRDGRTVALPAAAHNPGPWRASTQSDAVVADTAICEVRGADDIAYYGGYLIAESVARRNQPLIIAAPKLLATLIEIHAGMACTCRLEPLAGGPVPCQTCQISTLIAEAEGRS